MPSSKDFLPDHQSEDAVKAYLIILLFALLLILFQILSKK